jgi:hypothetical protein
MFAGRVAIASLGCATFVGCGVPNSVNIELRKQNQQLAAQVQKLDQQHEGDLRVIAGLRERQGSIPTLPTTRLAELFTTHSIEFGRLTGGADIDPSKPGDEGLAIYAVPNDQFGQMLKAAGSFDVEAFDLAEPVKQQIGKWHFNLQQSKDVWNGWALAYAYGLICPWQTVPHHADLTVRITFFDQLTQTPFTAQRIIHVSLPASAATQP